jgi:hypothetical protein
LAEKLVNMIKKEKKTIFNTKKEGLAHLTVPLYHLSGSPFIVVVCVFDSGEIKANENWSK